MRQPVEQLDSPLCIRHPVIQQVLGIRTEDGCLLEVITFGLYSTLKCICEGEGCNKFDTQRKLEHDKSFFVHTQHACIYSQSISFILIVFLSSAFTICYCSYSIMVKPHQADTTADKSYYNGNI